ncbi:MAG: cyclic nucleotide-binding domain-containing protein [Fuerstiella sp.]|nr:Crp/Fnr family transcriptional regulator [Fuerstiella sp.]
MDLHPGSCIAMELHRSIDVAATYLKCPFIDPSNGPQSGQVRKHAEFRKGKLLVTDDEFLLLRMHPCSEGLNDEVVREISEHCELLKIDSGAYVHRANQPFDSVFLLVHGRVKQSLIDGQGNVMLQRYQTSGGQFGALAAALGEPSPVNMIAEEPTTLLKLDYQKALDLTREHEVFRLNVSRLIADSVRNMLLKDRRQKKPVLVAVFYESPASRPLTRRLKSLGENPSVLNDQTGWQPMEDVPYCCLIRDGATIAEREIREQLHLWSDSNRICIDVSLNYSPVNACRLVEISDNVLWCVTPDNWKLSVYRLNAIEKRAPGWRDKINVVWLLNDGSPWAPLAPELTILAKRVYRISFDEPATNRNRAGRYRIRHDGVYAHREIAEVGARSTEDSVPQLKELLEQVDSQLFATE